MIIDADTHISPIRSNDTIQVNELIHQMGISNVDRSLCWLQPPYMRDIKESLKYIYESTKKYPDKLLGFGWVDPHFGYMEGKDTIKRCVEEYGFYGVKLNGAQNSFYIDDENVSFPLIEEIAKTGKILALHIGADAYGFTHPYRVAKIAKRYPEMKILLAHMGGVGNPDLANECIEVAQEYPNLYLIGSKISWGKIVKAIQVLGADRVCFGSDTPFSYMHADVCAYEAFLGDYVTKEQKELIMGGNIQRLLKL